TNVPLKPESAWRYLGKPMRRIDMVAKSTGTATFGIDLRLPGMVYATVRTNPRRGGGMKAYDARDAQKAKGVLKVVPATDGVGVIADNTWRAFGAAELIKFEWGPAPYPATSAAMFEAVKAAFVPAHKNSRLKNEGDVEAALAGARAIEAEYQIPYLAHAPLETMSAVVQFNNKRLDILTCTPIPKILVPSAA